MLSLTVGKPLSGCDCYHVDTSVMSGFSCDYSTSSVLYQLCWSYVNKICLFMLYSMAGINVLNIELRKLADRHVVCF